MGRGRREYGYRRADDVLQSGSSSTVDARRALGVGADVARGSQATRVHRDLRYLGWSAAGLRSVDGGQCQTGRSAGHDDAAFFSRAFRAGDQLEDLHRAAGELGALTCPARAGRGNTELRAFFVELAGNEIGDRRHGGIGLRAGDGDDDGCPRACRQHHQAHDGSAANSLAAARHPDFGVEALDQLNEFRRGARVKSALVDDGNFPGQRTWRDAWPGIVFGRRVVVAHLPARTRLAMVTYLRPASCAMAMASGSDRSSRTLASLTSIGRLMPASTSTFGRLMQEIARLDGVPPNISVRIATPSPLSTRLTASIMSLRRISTSSSGPMVTASIWFCGPTTCSGAARNSTASRPWVTSTRPIMELLVGASRLHRTKGRSS